MLVLWDRILEHEATGTCRSSIPSDLPWEMTLYLLDITRFNFWKEILIITIVCLYVNLSHYTAYLLVAKHPFDNHPL